MQCSEIFPLCRFRRARGFRGLIAAHSRQRETSARSGQRAACGSLSLFIQTSEFELPVTEWAECFCGKAPEKVIFKRPLFAYSRYCFCIKLKELRPSACNLGVPILADELQRLEKGDKAHER